MVIANTLFQQHKRQLYTWTSPDGQYWNQTDYILCSQRRRSSIESSKTRSGVLWLRSWTRYSKVQSSVQFSSLQSLSHDWLFVSPWTAAWQASLSITNSQSLLKLMSIEAVMRSNHLILCRPLFLLPSIFPSIRVFSSQLVLCIRWPKCWSFSFSISPSKEYLGLISLRIDWFDLLAVQESSPKP